FCRGQFLRQCHDHESGGLWIQDRLAQAGETVSARQQCAPQLCIGRGGLFLAAGQAARGSCESLGAVAVGQERLRPARQAFRERQQVQGVPGGGSVEDQQILPIGWIRTGGQLGDAFQDGRFETARGGL